MGDLFSLNGLIGGIGIGLAAAIFLLFLGRVMGVSGIVGNLMTRQGFTAWRLLFVVGLLIAPMLYGLIMPLPTIEITSNLPLLIIGGLLVGFGSAMSSGCTSGHSICGMARFSPASMLVTLLFIVAGGISLYIVKHLLGVV